MREREREREREESEFLRGLGWGRKRTKGGMYNFDNVYQYTRTCRVSDTHGPLVSLLLSP